ncbi:DUF3558 family protein [Prauserella endophytica]|uniref:DUF3558 domain-containing protein n=1 Tax=Prauserella endophytica TaxID=1592324 RepID=A0ABY2SC34_9PSEU|nr:DUF3558 family protein [Prauserella endophytica]TKG73475.1 DUF3558 domain-containing protein [Prauserella endophytica]
MRVRTLRTLPFAVVVTGLCLLAGCASSEGGTASPTPGNSPSSAATSDESPTSSAAPTDQAGSPEAIDPCVLLTVAEAEQFGSFTEPETRDELGARGCSYYPKRDGSSAGSLPTLIVGVRDEQAVDEVNDVGLGINTGQLNGREIAQVPGPGGCIIALALSDQARVDIGVTGLDTEPACELAAQVADVVEPKLPSEG